ncbi:DUF7343 domain-containing protein [Halopiger djelfimassiliensis]|uniref:DUF7343 domain-containing protein n=1 Tax=Halopiger djelfimassiliensis TaxID=1293047 RepID=UPI0006776E9F|nr:hypothetical protein [Halopiger djelfimassiliensis]
MDVRGLRALLCVFVVVGCLVALVPAASQSALGETGVQRVTLQEEPTESEQLDEADEVHIDVFLHENRSATFVIDYRFENTSAESWERLQTGVEENPDAYAAAERADWTEILEAGESKTEETMEITNVSVTTETSSAPRHLGHVEFTFEWQSFAYVELNRMEAGSALAGFTLVDDTTLRVFPPDGYVVHEVEPTPDDPPEDAVFWAGDGTEFTDDQPLIVMIEQSEDGETPAGGDGGPSMPWLAVLAALSVLVTVGAVGWWLTRDRREQPTGGANGTAHAVTDGAADRTESNGPPPELLSNEERVLQLLERRGGRIKQQEVVSELDWTEAKTSQVVGGLREDGEIEVFRIGRENVLTLPDEEIEE